MKKRTKIQSALAVAVLCSVMGSAYAAPEQQDLNITGVMETTSADTFTGTVPDMHYLDTGYVKNADGTYSKITASMTNGRPLMVNHSVNDVVNSRAGSNAYNAFWDLKDFNGNNSVTMQNTALHLLNPTIGSYLDRPQMFLNNVTIKYKDGGAEKEVTLNSAQLGGTTASSAYMELRELLDSEKYDIKNLTIDEVKDAWKNATNLVDGKEIKDIVDEIEEIKIVFMGINVGTKFSKDNQEVIYSYNNVNVAKGSEWAPMDYSAPIHLKRTYLNPSNYDILDGDITVNATGSTGGKLFENGKQYDEEIVELKHTYITVKNLNLDENSTVNMVKLNTMGDNPRVNAIDDPEVLRRHLWVDNATLANGATFKVGLYGYAGVDELDSKGNMSKVGGIADVILLKNGVKDSSVASDKKVNVNIALGYVPEIKGMTAISGEVNLFDGGTGSGNADKKAIVFSWAGNDIYNVKGVESKAEGVFDVYTITPVIEKHQDINHPNNAWYVKSYTYENSGYVSENVKSIADFHVTGDKVVRLQQDSFFRNAGGRELIDRHQGDVEHDNNVWADYYHGKVSSSSTYGRHISQSYNGYQVGYDTLMVPNYKNGNIYVGAYLSKIDSDSTIASGKGELDSVGFGLYGTWAGNRGHYIDGVISVNDLDNEYNYNNYLDGKVNGDYSHRYYTAAAQYGYRKHYDNGFFVEPKLSMSIGYGEGAEYQLSNGINTKMDDYKNIIGKAGAYVGKEFGNKGNVYVGAFYAHNYAKDMKGVLSYDNRNGEIATKDLDVVDLEDTWYEFNIGAKYALSPVSNIAVDYIKQTGSDIGNDWSLNCSYQLKF